MRNRGILLLGAILSGATQLSMAAEPPRPVPAIGTILFETGDESSYGIKVNRGYEMAFEWAKRKGFAIPELVHGDSAGDESKGVAELKRLAEEKGISFIVGLTGSGVAKAACPLLVENKVFVLEALDSAEYLSGCSPNFFRVYPSDIIQGAFLAEWAVREGRKSAAVLYVQNAWGEGLQKGLSERFRALGGKVILSEGVQTKIASFGGQVLKVKRLKPDVVFLLFYPTAARRWLEQARMRGVKSAVMGGDALTGAEVASAGSAADGLMFSAPFPGEGPEYLTFVQAFESRFGEAPDIYAIKSYDAMRLAIAALDTTKPNPESLREFFLGMKPFAGIAGDIRFDARGDIIGSRYARYWYQKGRMELLP